MTKRTGPKDKLSSLPLNGLTMWNGEFATALGYIGTAYTKACLEWQEEVTRFVNARVEQDRQAWESILNSRDPALAAKAQQDWSTKATQDYLEEAARLTKIAARFAQNGMTPLLDEDHRAPGGTQDLKAAE